MTIYPVYTDNKFSAWNWTSKFELLNVALHVANYNNNTYALEIFDFDIIINIMISITIVIIYTNYVVI